MKKLFKGLVVSSLFALCSLACADAGTGSCPAATITSPDFCESFKAATECHCANAGIHKRICSNMYFVYKTMVDAYGTLPRVCASQHHTSPQECIDDWNCYRYGGLTSDGQLCGGTGHKCG